MAVAVKFLTPAVGAEILGVDLRRLSDAEFVKLPKSGTVGRPCCSAGSRLKMTIS